MPQNKIMGKYPNANVYNVSSAYKKIRFDGDNYVREGTDEIICESHSFEFGAIYELGRVINDAGIDFRVRHRPI
jgi:hypothetical protein